jgi:hypothetical protein
VFHGLRRDPQWVNSLKIAGSLNFRFSTTLDNLEPGKRKKKFSDRRHCFLTAIFPALGL